MRSRLTYMSRACISAAAIWSALMMATAACSAGGPQRIVSLNLCTDELAIRLADPARIASVSWLSQQHGSNVVREASQMQANHGLGEQVLSARPDLVLAGTLTTRVTVEMLKRASVRVEEFGIPATMTEVRAQILRAGTLLGEKVRAEEMLKQLDERMTRVALDKPAVRPTAIVLNPNGFTVGRGTLVDEIMAIAGLDNIAANEGFDFRGQVPLEVVASQAIDILIVSTSRDGPPSLATNLLKHPILEKMPKTRIVVIPGGLWSCPGPAIADATERLHQAARAFADERRSR